MICLESKLISLGTQKSINYSDEEKDKILSIYDNTDSKFQDMAILGALLGQKTYSVDKTREHSDSSMDDSNDCLTSIWHLSFKSLDSRCHDLLSVLIFLEGDVGIHRSLFQTAQNTNDMGWSWNDAE